MIWYYANEGKRVGPIDEAEFQALIETGVITPETLVWNETLPKWLRYDEVTQGAPQSPPPRISWDMASCCECGKSFNQDDMIRYQDVWVCANCKPIFVQKLKEGAKLPGEMVYGGFWIRFAAKFLDGIIQGIIGFVVGITVGFVLSPAVGQKSPLTPLIPWLMNLFNIGLAAAYTTFFLGKYGATPGKMACGLKVVTSDGGKVSYARALGRHFAEWLSSLILLIGYIMAAFDEERRTLHDRICDTRVIKK